MGTEVCNNKGAIRISNAVIAKIAGYATTSCYGVVGMAAKSGKDGIWKLLKVENMDKGIKVKVEDNVIDLGIYIIVEYGTNITMIGESIKESVKYNVEKFTGMTLGTINVYVESVRVD